ncbi:MAG: DUF1127 domain-containing protein [Paracoccaceae bacterium]
MTYITAVNTIEIDFADRISSAFQGLFTDLVKSRLVRKTVRELNALSTRELDDLGMARKDIKAVAQRAVFGI